MAPGPRAGGPRVLLLPFVLVLVGLIVTTSALIVGSRTDDPWLAAVGGVVGALVLIAAVGSVILARTARRENEILRRYPGALLVPIVTKMSLASAARDLGARSRIFPGVAATMAVDQSSRVRFFMGVSRPRAVIVVPQERVVAVRPGLLQDGIRIYRVLELVAEGPNGEVVLPMIVLRQRDLLGRVLSAPAVESLIEDVRRAVLL